MIRQARSIRPEAAPSLETRPPIRTATNPTDLPPGVVHLSAPLAAAVDRLTWRLDDIAKALGISRRALERERSAGRLPRPDMVIGRRIPLWRVELDISGFSLDILVRKDKCTGTPQVGFYLSGIVWLIGDLLPSEVSTAAEYIG